MFDVTYQGHAKLRYQSGSALLLSLVILIVISFLAIGGMQGTILQDRMSANMHDRELAFQAAEAALRDAERMLLSDPPGIINKDGAYNIKDPGVPDWLASTSDNTTVGNGVFTYPQFTGSKTLSGVAEQPQFYVERIAGALPGTETETGVPEPAVFYYRVTARGFGATTSSVVVLRSVFRN